ncbi:MAG: hypothetical protein ACK4NF_06470, partial [Planctomycetota bacterium]
ISWCSTRSERVTSGEEYWQENNIEKYLKRLENMNGKSYLEILKSNITANKLKELYDKYNKEGGDSICRD